MFDMIDQISAGEWLGAELFVYSPTFQAAGGYGTQIPVKLAGPGKALTEKQIFRFPTTPQLAREQVQELKQLSVDGIRIAFVETNLGKAYPRMEPSIFQSVVQEAKNQQLPVAVLVSGENGLSESLEARVQQIEEMGENEISEELFARMARQKVGFVPPACNALEAMALVSSGQGGMLLSRSLVQQVGPRKSLEELQKQLQSQYIAELRQRSAKLEEALTLCLRNTRKASQTGVLLVASSKGGRPMILHGPNLHQELQLWVREGVPPKLALQAATFNAAESIGAGKRIGLIQRGYEANLLLVDGNPIQDISATERISLIVYKGERINRTELLNQMQKVSP